MPEIESPIEFLTEQQKASYYKEKADKFIEEVKKLQESTGMEIRATLDFYPHGIIPKLMILPITKKNENTTKGE